MNPQQDTTNATSERITDGYDRMLQRAEHTLRAATTRSEAALGQALDAAREMAIELGELTREEAEKVHEFVTRDLYDLGRFMAMEEREVADWLRLGTLVVENELLERVSVLAREAKLELKHFEKAKRRFDEWHTGEVTTIGILRCRHCGELVQFRHTARIPPCPKCHASVYERVKS